MAPSAVHQARCTRRRLPRDLNRSLANPDSAGARPRYPANPRRLSDPFAGESGRERLRLLFGHGDQKPSGRLRIQQQIQHVGSTPVATVRLD